MEIIPLAYDSFGARSMCTLVRQDDVTIIIDPGVALGPSRYGLPPHPLEIQRMNELWDEIKKHGSEAELFIITHYHYDHHDPNDIEFLRGKRVLLKHPTEKINFSQKKRAAFFIQQIKNICEIEHADGKSFEVGNLQITISEPVFHGKDSRLGFVVEVLVEGKKRVAYTSDVEGPIHHDQVQPLLDWNPEIVFIDGPMTYMLGYRYSAASLESSKKNLQELVIKTDVKVIVLDHHLTRDLAWRDRMSDFIEFAESHGVEVMSAAQFAGREEELLEGLRKRLYEANEGG